MVQLFQKKKKKKKPILYAHMIIKLSLQLRTTWWCTAAVEMKLQAFPK